MKLIHTYQSLPDEFYTVARPDIAPAPQLICFNTALAQALGLRDLPSETVLADWFSGKSLPPSAQPIAQAYAGHQFGQLNMLGDGRAVLLGELKTLDGRVDIQLKGSGRTPFSRGGDGKAALAPMLREYLISEVMFALGIPTTRSLAVTTTGETVRRMGAKIGAVLTRTAAGHLRVGTFVYAAMLAQRDGNNAALQSLSDYAIARHYPDCQTAANPALALLHSVISAQIHLLVHWQRVGFVHGVLNTDNVALSGETLDYGPCAFMERYDPMTVFSSIDHGGRYAFANQVPITQWNLARFAETLLPLIDADSSTAINLASEAVNTFPERHQRAWQTMMCNKLGVANHADSALANDLLDLMQQRNMDYTNTFNALTNIAAGHAGDLPADTDFRAWQSRWQALLDDNSTTVMSAHNPFIIPRNHAVEAALTAADNGDLSAFEALLNALKTPYHRDHTACSADYQTPATVEWAANYQTFCGT